MTQADYRQSLAQALISNSCAVGDQLKLEDSVLQTLSSTCFAEVDKFKVEAQIAGLVEKCQISNKESLGEALRKGRQRLTALAYEWTPEILALLIHLSYRPLQNVNFEDLLSLTCEEPSASLQWSDIFAADPLEDQTAIWHDIDFAADGSDEEDDIELTRHGIASSGRSLTSSSEDIPSLGVEHLIIPINHVALVKVSATRIGRDRLIAKTSTKSSQYNQVQTLDEVFVIREAINMLFGLPTSIFRRDAGHQYALATNVNLSNVSQIGIESLLQDLLNVGTRMALMRDWITLKPQNPVEQTFRLCLQSHITTIEKSLRDMQTRILCNPAERVVSLLALHYGMVPFSSTVDQLHNILCPLWDEMKTSRAFHILQNLYDRCDLEQRVGSRESFALSMKMFSRCFATYLKPITNWMQKGEIDNSEQSMFIQKRARPLPLHDLWHDQYFLVENPGETLHAPRFLHVAAKRIFNAGKSVNFLKLLGLDDLHLDQTASQEFLTGEDMLQALGRDQFIPFSEVFEGVFGDWTASNSTPSVNLLTQTLQSHCGLQRSLDALEYIYLLRNDCVTNGIFPRLFEEIKGDTDKLMESSAVLDCFHSALLLIDSVDTELLEIQCINTQIPKRSTRVYEALSVSYELPWPVANVIVPSSISTYNRVFILLAQLQTAKHSLLQHKVARKLVGIYYILRTGLLWFINAFNAHLTTLVIEVSTKDMRRRIVMSEDVDDMILVHREYMAELQDRCFLSERHSSLHQAIISVLDLTLRFADIEASMHDCMSHQKTAMGDEFSGFLGAGHDIDMSRAPLSLPLLNEASDKPRLALVKELVSIHDTYVQLLAIIISCVDAECKTEGSLAWEILACNLAQGLVVDA